MASLLHQVVSYSQTFVVAYAAYQAYYMKTVVVRASVVVQTLEVGRALIVDQALEVDPWDVVVAH